MFHVTTPFSASFFTIDNSFLWKEELGQNCDTYTVIENKDECKDALLSLGLDPRNLEVNNNGRPAGCYWSSTGNGFFNKVVDPDLTNPNDFDNRGGVCSPRVASDDFGQPGKRTKLL